MAIPLHLTQGDHAATLLRAAVQFHGLPGIIFSIPEDLTHGPLHDGPARFAYFRAAFQGFAPWPFTHTDAFAPWQELLAHLDHASYPEIVIWAGNNASEATFLPMACDWLHTRPEPLSRAHPPSNTYTGQLAPNQLAALYASRQPLDAGTRQRLAGDFARIRDQTGLHRRWRNGGIVGVAADHDDHLLLAACPAGWTPANRVIGTAMAACDPANRLSDLYLAMRLHALIAAGRIAADSPASPLNTFAVRRMPDTASTTA